MPLLSCGVFECAYNSSSYCCKDYIDVAGLRATQSTQTFCSSYRRENIGFSNDNIHMSPKDSVAVRCKAEKCFFNGDGICCADTIVISENVINSTEHNCCASFYPRR